ncbi:Protein MAIN-LIKE 2 [Glycine max]|nr:Protein MAIN-LIKE 2 [Glycine max]
MVSTRGLGRALGHAIGKVLGRRDESDDDVPQWRRPIASACRQRQQQVVLVDPPMAEEELVDDQLEAHVEEGVADVVGFLGGSHDTSECPELKLSSHGRKMTKFGRPAPEIEGHVVASGLSPLIAYSLDTCDHGLMSAFVEYWHKVTSSFHLSVRKVTITLDDIASLLHLPTVEVFHSFEQLHVDNVVEMLVELLEVSAIDARAETIQCHGSYVQLSWLCDLYELKIEACEWIVSGRAYLLHLFGCTLFANKSVTHMHVVFLDALCDLKQSVGYAWGAAALVYMYDNLNDCWIYEHFSSIASTVPVEDYDKMRLHACRWTSGKALPVATYRRRLDRLTLDAVCWIPYGDHRSFREFEVISLFFDHLRWAPLTVIHRPKRVVRKFGYIQTILPHPVVSLLSIAEIDDRWMQFGEYIALVGQLCAVSGHCSPDYLDWFYMISHPFMSPAQPGDPPRAPPDDFVAIADRLEKLLNLRILTEGTEAYTVVEDCVAIARRFTGQPTVAHKSRRRRRMDGH